MHKYCVTINPWAKCSCACPGGKRKEYGVLKHKQQIDILLAAVSTAMRKNKISEMFYTLELTKEVNYHLHGYMYCTDIQAKEFQKDIFAVLGHYKQTMFLMEVCCKIKQEFTDDGKWSEYMTKQDKNVKHIQIREFFISNEKLCKDLDDYAVKITQKII